MKFLTDFAWNLYKASPVFFQNIMISAQGFVLKKQRYGVYYKKWFRYYSEKDNSNYKSELEIQNARLISLVKFANKNSVFYRQLYSDIDIDSFKGIEDLYKLPIVSKEDLRNNIKEVYTIDPKDGIKSFTGGTTGKALEVIFDKEDAQERMAYLDYFKSKVGVDSLRSSKATFSGREFIHNISSKTKVFWRYNKAYNQKLYSTFHMNKKTLPLYINDLNSFKPEIINGFVSAIYELAFFIKNNSIELDFSPKAIFTTSETLLPFHRELIEEVFECHIYNQYASAEGAPFITECINGNLHYNIDTGVIESFGESGEILVTSFTTSGTPLIRYDIGDLITFLEGECSCGSSHPLVKEIQGRAVDFLETKSGSKVSLSHLSDVVKGMPSCVLNVQFIQNKIDEIIISVVVDDKLFLDCHEKTIIDSMSFRFGEETNFILIKVKDIPKEKSGKYSLIKKNI